MSRCSNVVGVQLGLHLQKNWAKSTILNYIVLVRLQIQHLPFEKGRPLFIKFKYWLSLNFV